MRIEDFCLAEAYHKAEDKQHWLLAQGDDLASTVEILLAYAEIPVKRRERISALLDFDKAFPRAANNRMAVMDHGTRLDKAERFLSGNYLRDEAFEVTYQQLDFQGNPKPLKKIVVTDDVYKIFDLIPLSMHVMNIEAKGTILTDD